MKRFPALYLLTIFLLLPAFPILAQSDKQVNSHSFTYQYLTTKEGLSNQRVFSILEDKKGFIWISTRSGVDCFNGRTVKTTAFSGKTSSLTEPGA